MRPEVRDFFSEPGNYLAAPYYVAARADAIAELTGPLTGCDILDVGCGDGSISALYAGQGNRLTMVDSSQAMLDLAGRRLRRGASPETPHLLCAELMALEFGAEFDWVFALGLLAHVAEPELALARLVSFVRPGGSLVLQYTDASTLTGAGVWLYDTAKEAVRPRRGYRLTRLSTSRLRSAVHALGLREAATVPLCFDPPGLRRVLSDKRCLALQSRLRKSPTLHWLCSDRALRFVRPL
jgi:SAM-dependent methyltransferase